MFYKNKGELLSTQKEIFKEEQDKEDLEVGLFEEPVVQKKIDYFALMNRDEVLLDEINKLSHRLDEDFLEFAIVNFDSFTDKNKGAFLDRVGRYDDQRVEKLLASFAQGKPSPMRLRAIKGIGRFENLTREKLIKKIYKKRSHYNSREQMAILGSYYSVLSNNKEIDKIIFDLLRFIKVNKDHDAVLMAFIELNKIDPYNKRGIKAAEKILLENRFSESVELTNFLVRMLSRYSSKKTIKNYFKYFEHPSMKVKIELINALSTLCPPKVWDMFHQIVDDNPNTRIHLAVARQLIFFDNEKSLAFFKAKEKDLKIEQDIWRKIRVKILESELYDTCDKVSFKRPEK